jgi:gas vesicle protein
LEISVPDPVVTNSLAPSIFGLIGVVVGAIISTATNLILAVRKERAEDKSRKRDREIVFKRAIRIVGAEVMQAKRIIEVLLGQGTWPATELKTTITAWERYK